MFYFSFDDFKGQLPEEMFNTLKMKLDEKDIELEMKDVEIDTQKKKIEVLLTKVSTLNQRLKIQSESDYHVKLELQKKTIEDQKRELKLLKDEIVKLKNELYLLNQKLGNTEPDQTRKELHQERNNEDKTISQKFEVQIEDSGIGSNISRNLSSSHSMTEPLLLSVGTKIDLDNHNQKLEETESDHTGKEHHQVTINEDKSHSMTEPLLLSVGTKIDLGNINLKLEETESDHAGEEHQQETINYDNNTRLQDFKIELLDLESEFDNSKNHYSSSSSSDTLSLVNVEGIAQSKSKVKEDQTNLSNSDNEFLSNQEDHQDIEQDPPMDFTENLKTENSNDQIDNNAGDNKNPTHIEIEKSKNTITNKEEDMLIHFYLIEHYLLSFILSNTFLSF